MTKKKLQKEFSHISDSINWLMAEADKVLLEYAALDKKLKIGKFRFPSRRTLKRLEDLERKAKTLIGRERHEMENLDKLESKIVEYEKSKRGPK